MITFNDIPDDGGTLKYSLLGELSLLNHKQYCDYHGYTFIDTVEIDRSRPACWAKIPAILKALNDHEWVLWADSDTLIFDKSKKLEDFCDNHYNLIVQYQEHWWKLIGFENGTEKVPINSGVFLIKSSDWSRHFLEEAYTQTQYVSNSKIWDRIGDQEGMNYVIRNKPKYREQIKYDQGLQTSPLFYNKGEFMVHFYGNHFKYYIPPDKSQEILDRWERAIKAGNILPNDLKKFHWCCVQNNQKDSAVIQGDLKQVFYSIEDLR